MSTFGGIYFTNKGRALQAKSLTGAKLNFTRISVGDGNLNGQAVEDLSALIHEIKSIELTKLKADQNGKVTIGGILSNQNIASGFYWRELGLFAQDPDLGEILYCYSNAGNLAEYIPSPNGADILEKRIDIVAIVGNAANVSASINSSLVYASASDLVDSLEEAKSYTDNKVVNEVNTNLSSHMADYVRQPGYGVTTGSANTYVLTLNPAPTSYVDGMGIAVKINVANTGVPTINVNGLGAKTIKDSLGNDITAGGLKQNNIYSLKYEATSGNFIAQGKGGGGSATPDKLLLGEIATVDKGPIVGTMSNRTLAVAGGHTDGSGKGDNSGNLYVSPSMKGFYEPEVDANGYGEIKLHDVNYIAANIANTASIFGLQGTAILKGNAQFNSPGTYTWTVPTGITQVTVTLTSASGGQGGGQGGGVDYYHPAHHAPIHGCHCGDYEPAGWDIYATGGAGSNGYAGGVTSFGSLISISSSAGGLGGSETSGYRGGNGGMGAYDPRGSYAAYSDGGVASQGHGGISGDTVTTSTTTQNVTPGSNVTITVGSGGSGGSGGVGATFTDGSYGGTYTGSYGGSGVPGSCGRVSIQW